MTLRDDVGRGRLEGLRALRDVLAAEIEAGPPEHSGRGPVPVSQTAALARQLQDVLRQIEELEKAQPKGSRVDDLANRRKVRRADAAVRVAASGGGDKRG